MTVMKTETKTSVAGRPWEPSILMLCCKRAAAADARLARISRIQMIMDPRILHLPCSGNMDPALCVQLLREGMDGVLVLGCHPGDCCNSNGNHFAEMKMSWTRLILKKTELDDERLRIDWMSASEDQLFTGIVSDFMDRLRAFGPNPVNDPDRVQMREQLEAAILTLNDLRIRALMDKVRTLEDQGNVYGEAVDREELNAAVVSALESEYLRKSVLVMLKGNDMTVPQLARRLSLSPETIMTQVVRLRQRNLLDISRIDGLDPSYKISGGVIDDR